MRQFHRIMEIFWLSTAIFSLFISIYMVKAAGFKEGGIYLLLPFVATVMFILRRRYRRTLDKQEQSK